MYIVLLGAPGSGKGTQAKRLQKLLSLMHVASGDLFRDNLKRKTLLGELARTFMDRGDLVPDDVTIKMLRERWQRPDVASGVILDGFPRTLAQAQALDELLGSLGRKLDRVLYLDVSDEELVNRLSSRVVCKECQRPFHLIFNPFEICPESRCKGEFLYQRSDDKPETVAARLGTFHEQTRPLIDYFGKRNLLEKIDGQGSLDEVTRRIERVVQQPG